MESDSDVNHSNTTGTISVFRLRRPWQWYGPAYLPEFWLTLVLGVGFLWSVWRDRRLGTRA